MSKQFTNKMQNQVKEFHETFGHPVEEKPTLVDLKRFTDRQSWGTIEEAIELLHAISNTDEEFEEAFKQLMNGAREGYHKQLKKKRPKTKEEKLVAIADALADKLYFVLGDAVEAGIDIELVMNHVHQSNMSKLFEAEDGTLYAEYTDKGKVKKSDRFFEPEPKIKEEIKNQLNSNKGSLYVSLDTTTSEDKSVITVTQGGYIVGNLEVNDLIPKEYKRVNPHDGVVEVHGNVDIGAPKGGYIEGDTLIPKEVTVNKGEVILNKQDAKNIISQSNKKPSKKIKDSVEKVTSEQVKDVIESVLSNKDSE